MQLNEEDIMRQAPEGSVIAPLLILFGLTLSLILIKVLGILTISWWLVLGLLWIPPLIILASLALVFLVLKGK